MVVCATTLPWSWKTPDAAEWLLMLGLGLVATIGQYFIYEGFRHASASALASTKYTGLVWAFIYGFAIWAKILATHVFV